MQWAAQYFSIGTHVLAKNHEHQRQGREREKKERYTDVSDVSGECVKKQQAFNS